MLPRGEREELIGKVIICGVQTKSISIEARISLVYILINFYNYNKQTYKLVTSMSIKSSERKKKVRSDTDTSNKKNVTIH